MKAIRPGTRGAKARKIKTLGREVENLRLDLESELCRYTQGRKALDLQNASLAKDLRNAQDRLASWECGDALAMHRQSVITRITISTPWGKMATHKELSLHELFRSRPGYESHELVQFGFEAAIHEMRPKIPDMVRELMAKAPSRPYL